MAGPRLPTQRSRPRRRSRLLPRNSHGRNSTYNHLAPGPMSDALAGNETVVDHQDARRTGQAHASHALATVFAQGFRLLATITGVGVLLTLFCAVGVLQTRLMPVLFRVSLSVFTGGFAFG